MAHQNEAATGGWESPRWPRSPSREARALWRREELLCHLQHSVESLDLNLMPPFPRSLFWISHCFLRTWQPLECFLYFERHFSLLLPPPPRRSQLEKMLWIQDSQRQSGIKNSQPPRVQYGRSYCLHSISDRNSCNCTLFHKETEKRITAIILDCQQQLVCNGFGGMFLHNSTGSKDPQL